MSFYIYEKDTGRLESVGSVAPEKLKDKHAMVELVDDDTMVWDETLLNLVPRPPVRTLSVDSFRDRFTETEFKELVEDSNKASQSLVIYMQMVRVLDLDGPFVQDAMTISSLSEARKAEVLANV